MTFGLLGLAIGLVLLALVTGFVGRGYDERAGLPAGEVVYRDKGRGDKQNKVLFAKDVQLAGKPDYLIEQADGSIVPVEVKSRPGPNQPHEGHVLQLAAYCYLVEQTYGKRPPYGVIQYSDCSFEVDYTEELREDLLDVLAYMREDLLAPDVPRDHDNWRRCANCGHRRDCGEALDQNETYKV